MLVETLIVCVFVGVTLVFLFVQLRNISNSYDRSFTYNTTNALYSAGKIKEYLEKMDWETLKQDIEEKEEGYIDITSCNKSYYTPIIGEEDSFKEYCTLLYQKLNIKKILISKEDLTSIKYKIAENREKDTISQKMLDFIDYVPYDKEDDTYRILVEYKDGTFASVKIRGSENS